MQVLEHQLQQGMKEGVVKDVHLVPLMPAHQHGAPLQANGGFVRLLS